MGHEVPDDDRVAQFADYFMTQWETKSTTWQERATQTNIYEVVELFKTEQAATEVSLLQLEAGGVVVPTRRVFRQRLKTIQEKFSNVYSIFRSALSNWVGFRKL